MSISTAEGPLKVRSNLSYSSLAPEDEESGRSDRSIHHVESGMSAHARMRRDSAKFPKQETEDLGRRKNVPQVAKHDVGEDFHPVAYGPARLAYLYPRTRLEADTAQEEGSTGHSMGLSRLLPGLSIQKTTL